MFAAPPGMSKKPPPIPQVHGLLHVAGIMGKPHALAIALLGALVVIGWFLFQRTLEPERRAVTVEAEDGEAPPRSGVEAGPAGAADHDREAADRAVVRDDVVYHPRDVEIFRETMEWARQEGLDTAPLGTAIVGIGRRFVGHPYTPHTLDLPGEERLVVNLREFDCVTYVESVLALARTLRSDTPDFATFLDELATLRYRNGEMDGYVSRLHYFSEWIADNEQLGRVREITRELDGTRDPERIDFMSTHADAYEPLDGHPDRIERIREIEQRLSQRPRYYIPQAEIGAVADGIHDGDVIAATSSVEGLDVAHTGFAIRIDGRLHLMHAPLVGKSLEISDQPLAVRILRIDGQDGIMVARPL